MYPPPDQVCTIFEEVITFHGDGELELKSDSGDVQTHTVTGNKQVSVAEGRHEFKLGGKCGVLIRSDTTKTFGFNELFPHADDRLNIETGEDTCWIVTGEALAGANTPYTLGTPNNVEQSMSFWRRISFWMQPHAEKGKVYFPNDQGVAVQFQRKDGLHVVVVGVAGETDATTYLHGDGELKAYVENDLEYKPNGFKLRVAANYTLEDAWKIAFPVKDKVKPKTDWYKGLIYCTWNGLGLGMDQHSVLDMLQELHDNDIHVTGLLLDDGWQTQGQDRRLYRLEADDKMGKLKDFTAKVRKQFPYIKEIGVWSTIIGYWNGFVPGSEVDQMFETVDVHGPGQDWRMPANPHKFFDEYFKFLHDSGVTFVKIDNQATIDDIKEREWRGKLWKPYQDALYESAVKYFDYKIIYCMAMVPNIMQYLPGAPVFRNSDDFFPHVPESHTWHNYTNLYTSQYTRHLHGVLDYDMFQTKMPQPSSNFPGLHAAVRCISNGPIYFTDSKNEHDFELINKFTAKRFSGDNVILTLNDDPHLMNGYLSSGNIVKTKSQCNGANVIGLFNTSDQTQETTVVETDYFSRAFNNKGLFKGTQTFTLNPGEWEIITTLPLLAVEPKTTPLRAGKSSDEWIRVGFLGKLDHIVGVAAIDSMEVTAEKTHIEACCTVSVQGTFGFVVENSPGECQGFVSGQQVELRFDKGIYEIDVFEASTESVELMLKIVL